jgi:hypothetical protein
MRMLGFLLLAACAAHAPVPVAPDYAPVATTPMSARAGFYTACLADAIESHRVGQAVDADTVVLVFTCRDAPARAFYEGLAEWSAQKHSQFEYRGRTFRSTAPVHRDLFGVDYCSTDGHDHECVISLNAGAFVQTSDVH